MCTEPLYCACSSFLSQQCWLKHPTLPYFFFIKIKIK